MDIIQVLKNDANQITYHLNQVGLKNTQIASFPPGIEFYLRRLLDHVEFVQNHLVPELEERVHLPSAVGQLSSLKEKFSHLEQTAVLESSTQGDVKKWFTKLSTYHEEYMDILNKHIFIKARQSIPTSYREELGGHYLDLIQQEALDHMQVS